MTTTEERSAENLNDHKPLGHGRMLRKEDPRFIRGLGRYCDDVQLPGMLHLAILRSPLAHARILSIDTTAAEAHPKVKAVVTGETLAGLGLAWMPTLSNDVQAVLATDKVRFQGQEVAFVVAEDRYAARDALELIDVEYEPLPPVIDARTALAADAPVIRDDLKDKTDNHVFDWETGDKDATDAVFAKADVVVTEDIVYPRVHPAPMETCGAVADFDRVSGKLTLWSTTQAPHAHRTLYAIVAGIPEHKIRVISPDIGGGFGNKVPIYPGYVCAVVGSIVTGKPVKWMEDRSENLISTGFARDYIMRGEIAATQRRQDPGHPHPRAGRPRRVQRHRGPGEVPGRVLRGVHRQLRPGGGLLLDDRRLHEQGPRRRGLRLLVPDHRGRVPGRADRRLPGLRAGDGPGGAAVAQLHPARAVPVPHADRLGVRLGRLRADHAQGHADRRATTQLRREQAEKRERGELMGIGVAFFTEAVGAGPRKDMDILGLGMADGCELRVHPTGKAVVRLSVQSQGQGHETTFAQIVAEEIGIPPDDIDVVHGDTDNTPFGLGTYGSRSTPVSGAAAALVARKVRDKAQLIASAMLEVSVADLEWEKGRFQVKGDPTQSVTIQDIAMRAHGAGDLPDGIEGGLEAQICYNPENLTYPFGAYICVVDIDPGTAEVKVRRFVAVDDCGTRINPMIIEGQVHGGLTDGVGMALMEIIAFDEDGNCLGASLMDYLIPTALEVPDWETDFTVTPSPHHPIGAKGVGESATVGLAAGHRQRRGRRAGPVRGAARGHAAHPVPGVGRHAGPPDAADLSPLAADR